MLVSLLQVFALQQMHSWEILTCNELTEASKAAAGTFLLPKQNAFHLVTNDTLETLPQKPASAGQPTIWTKSMSS